MSEIIRYDWDGDNGGYIITVGDDDMPAADVVKNLKKLDQLIHAVKSFKSQFSKNGDYSFRRRDGERMGMGEIMFLGSLMENLDGLIDKGRR